VDVLVDVVDALRAGHEVTVTRMHQRLTTQEAADILNVSRPTLVKLLETGEIPFEQPGRHRRVRLADVLAYRDRLEERRDAALVEIIRISEEAGLYDIADVPPPRTR
jgi:excisionase family DNA binding protein